MKLTFRSLITSSTIVVTLLASNAAMAEATVKAVASFSILGDFVQRVGGDRVEVTTIVSADGDAHIYEPKPDDAKAVSAANIMFVNGLGFEGWLDRLTEASGYKGKTVVATTGIEAESMAEAHDHSAEAKKEPHKHAEGEAAHTHAEGESGHDHGETDPHAWQSAANAQVYVKNIAAGLCEVDAAGCDTYNTNAAAYTKELEALNASIKDAVAKIPEDRRVVITSHDAFGYFTHEYV